MFFKVKPIDSFLLSSFYELGMKIGKFPKLHAFISLFISLLITVAPLLSPYELVIERSAPRLWNPTSAQTFKDWKESLKFGGGELYPAFLVVRPAELEGNLLTADLMSQILLVHEDIVSEIGDPSEEGTFETWCVRGGVDGEGSCVVGNFLALFNYDVSNVPELDEDVLAMVNAMDEHSPVEAILGGVERGENGTVLGASSLMLSYPLLKSTSPKFPLYESVLVSSLSPSRFPLLTVDAITESTLDNDIVNAIKMDMPLLFAALAMVVVWLALSLGWDRKHLALSALVTTILSLSVALGIQGIMGWKICSLNFFVSFVVAGVGVDDMIVIDDCYQGLKASSPSSTPTELIAETLSKAGVSILLTSFTSIVAFMVGAFTDIPAVVYFCRNAALSFTWCFVLNVTLFPSLLVIDERRRSRGGEGGGEKAWGLGLREAASVALEKYSSLLSRPTFKALVFVVTLSAAWVCREEAM
ncbi:hypothetical protein TrRE_jg4181, partial [Triparma retinervis]